MKTVGCNGSLSDDGPSCSGKIVGLGTTSYPTLVLLDVIGFVLLLSVDANVIGAATSRGSS